MDQPFFILGALVLGSWWNRVPEAAALQAATEAETEVRSPHLADPAERVAAPTVVGESLPAGPEIQRETQAGSANPTRYSTDRYPAFEEESEEAPDRTPPQRLAIPDLQVDSTVVLKPFVGNTWDIRGLNADVAWLEGTAHPAAGGNTVLAGHIMVRTIGRGPFRFLDRLKPGAKVVVYTQQKVYTYQVREQVVVKETDGEVTQDMGQTQLTLLTCTTWDEKTETYLRRRAVFADLVEVKPLLPENEW